MASEDQVQVCNVRNMLFDNQGFETERDYELRDYLVDGVIDSCAEIDYSNGNHYWLPDDEVPEIWEVIEQLLSADDAPEGIREWYAEH